MDFVTVLGTCGQGVGDLLTGTEPGGGLSRWDGEWGWGVKRDFFCSGSPRRMWGCF